MIGGKRRAQVYGKHLRYFHIILVLEPVLW